MTPADRIEFRVRRWANTAATGSFHRWRLTAMVAALSRFERRIPFASPDRLEHLQRKRLRDLVDHAFRTVPFYRDLKRDGLDPASIRSAEDIARLPMIDAGALVDDPMRFVCDEFRTSGREVFKTSGSSSGLRKPIFWDHGSLLLRAARAERDRVVIARLAEERWTSMIVREFLTNEKRRFVARRFGIDTDHHQRLLILPADFSSRTQRTIYSERTTIPRRPVHYNHLPPSVPFEVAAAHLRAIRPRVVFSFGSYVDQFFHYLESTDSDVPLPKLWVYLGDRLSPGGREIAEERGCRLYSVYGAMEAGTIGFQCEHRDGFHLNTDLCIVRIVDKDGEELPPGHVGSVTISPLDNRAMVLLNYNVGDLGAISTTPCACGRTLPRLSRFEGRQSEYVRLGDGREIGSITIEAMFSRELRRTIQARLEQDEPGHLRWRVVAAAGETPDALALALKSRAAKALGVDTRVEVTFSDHIPLTEAGKFVRAVHRQPVANAKANRNLER